MNAPLPTAEVKNDTHDECGPLFAQALRGDSDAATRLYTTCVPTLRAWLVARLPWCLAADLAHDALVQAFRRAGQFRPGASFAAWLRTIAWNMAMNTLRDDGRRKMRESAYWDHERIQSSSSEEPDTMLLTAVQRSVASLPEDQRELLDLRFQQGRSASEIAANSGRSRVAVAVSLHRICKRLRADIKALPGFSNNSHHIS